MNWSTQKIGIARLVGAALCTIAAMLIALDMTSLMEQKELWTQQPLWFWLSVWGAILLLLGGHITTLPQPWKLLGASLLSGVLLAGGFMPMPTFFLSFVAFVPLLWAERQVAAAREKASKWTIFKLAFCTFFTWNLLSTWWIQNSSFPAGIFGNTLNAIFMCIPFVFYHITHKRLGVRAANWGLIGYWLTFELGHLNWDLSWPWLTLGNSFAHLPSIVQWYEYTGVFGGSLWILGANLYLINLLCNSPERKSTTAIIARMAILILLPIGVSLALYYNYDTAAGEAVEVVAVQPNYEPHYHKFNTATTAKIADHQALAKEYLTDKTDYLIFPETSFNYSDSSNISRSSITQSFRTFITDYPKLNLVMGISSYREYDALEEKPPSVSERCHNGRCRYFSFHNAAIQLNNTTENIPYYVKSKLVPGAEIMPFIGGVPFFKNLILDLGGISGTGLSTQTERAVFSSKNGVVAPLICYESIYGGFVTDYTKKGAEIFFVLTNDGWWGDTWGQQQHLHLSRLRAIENRRDVVRAANSGTSCIINARGDVLQATNYNEATALRGTAHLHQQKTFYVQYGNLIGRVSILLSAWFLVTMLANVAQLKRKN